MRESVSQNYGLCYSRWPMIIVLLLQGKYPTYRRCCQRQQPCRFTGTKESAYIRKEFNSQGLVWNTNMAVMTRCVNAVLKWHLSKKDGKFAARWILVQAWDKINLSPRQDPNSWPPTELWKKTLTELNQESLNPVGTRVFSLSRAGTEISSKFFLFINQFEIILAVYPLVICHKEQGSISNFRKE